MFHILKILAKCPEKKFMVLFSCGFIERLNDFSQRMICYNVDFPLNSIQLLQTLYIVFSFFTLPKKRRINCCLSFLTIWKNFPMRLIKTSTTCPPPLCSKLFSHPFPHFFSFLGNFALGKWENGERNNEANRWVFPLLSRPYLKV